MNTHVRNLRLGWLVALPLALAALLLAACGQDEPEPTPAPTNTVAALDVGDPAPDFTLSTAGGGTVSLDDYTGQQPVLLYFHMAAG